jgi:hypothetical protein
MRLLWIGPELNGSIIQFNTSWGGTMQFIVDLIPIFIIPIANNGITPFHLSSVIVSSVDEQAQRHGLAPKNTILQPSTHNGHTSDRPTA